MRQPEAVLFSVTLILILSISPEGRVTVAVALPFFICGVLTLKLFSQSLSQSCAQIKMVSGACVRDHLEPRCEI